MPRRSTTMPVAHLLTVAVQSGVNDCTLLSQTQLRSLSDACNPSSPKTFHVLGPPFGRVAVIHGPHRIASLSVVKDQVRIDQSCALVVSNSVQPITPRIFQLSPHRCQPERTSSERRCPLQTQNKPLEAQQATCSNRCRCPSHCWLFEGTC